MQNKPGRQYCHCFVLAPYDFPVVCYLCFVVDHHPRFHFPLDVFSINHHSNLHTFWFFFGWASGLVFGKTMGATFLGGSSRSFFCGAITNRVLLNTNPHKLIQNQFFLSVVQGFLK
jgi:hypothetical protein